MLQEPTGTKLALICAAGELFAEHGLEGTSVRGIADKAGVNIAAINYHFGGKDKLYTETLRYAILQGTGRRPVVFLEDPEKLRSPGGAAQVISDVIHERFVTFFSPKQPRWYGRLIVRSLLDPSSSLEEMVREIFGPDHEAVQDIVKYADPEMTDEQAELWAYLITAGVAFFAFCREPVLMFQGRKEYSKTFLDAAAAHLARTVTTALGLPQLDPPEA